MFDAINLSNESIDYESKDYLTKTKLDVIRIHIIIQSVFSLLLLAYFIILRFQINAIIGQVMTVLTMLWARNLIAKDKAPNRAAIVVSLFYSVFLFPILNISLGSLHVFPVLMSLYSAILIILFLEGRTRTRVMMLYLLICVAISIKDITVVTQLYGFSSALNRYISLIIAFILAGMTVWVFKDTIIYLSDENYKNSLIDKMTGVFNYASFERELEQNIKIFERHHDNFAVAMIDIDNFKLINDSKGHREGDQFLKAFVGHVRKYIRGEDFLARYGGDEFIILFPRCSAIEAREVISRIYNESKDLLKNYSDYNVSFSTGVADYSEATNENQSIVDLADKRMYENKTTKTS